MRRIVLWIVMLSLLPFQIAIAEDDFQYWQRLQVKALDTRYVDFTNYWDLRFIDDASDLGIWFTSQKLAFDPISFLNLGANYTYLESETMDSKTKREEFKFQHRFELEVTPHYELKNWFKISNRNRMEFRWIEDKGSDNGRYRQLWELEIPIKKVFLLKSVYANNEFFVDFGRHQINENRVTPIGMTFTVYRKTTLKIFYLIQSKKGTRDWSSNQVLGTHLSVAFG